MFKFLKLNIKFIFTFFVFVVSLNSFAKPKIALVVKSLNNEFFKEMKNGVDDYQKKHADEMEIIFKSDSK